MWGLAEVRAKGSLRPVSAQKPRPLLGSPCLIPPVAEVLIFSHLTGLGDGTPGLCEAAVGSPCLPLPSSSPPNRHTQSRQHWGVILPLPEDKEKAPHLERDKATHFLVRGGGKRL